ncbi:MAG TPA: DUF4215 domain-containing protein [Polyangia bacterium]|jgi:cysteine-rich repeat protein|nr:DUF4215 domain-containing protein [Polyangia bacterium]
MASLGRLPAALLLVAIGIGCGTRPLDRHDPGGTTTGAAGSVAADAGVATDVRPDLIPIPIVPVPDGRCGNGVLDPGEQCDDGNRTPGDGCTRLCQVECGSTCGSCSWPGSCNLTPVCGDGVLAPSELCDDGNNVGGDGCANNCSAIETGWRCPIAGRRCVPICGDGVVVGAERCDDGNAVAGDGCSDICLVEPASGDHCGNGVIDGAEECDDGANHPDAGYGGCGTDCRFGGFCGDGVVNGPEQCDLGTGFNTTVYGNFVGCAPGCFWPHICGDGIVDDVEGEQCDLGANNGIPDAACSASCQIRTP